MTLLLLVLICVSTYVMKNIKIRDSYRTGYMAVLVVIAILLLIFG